MAIPSIGQRGSGDEIDRLVSLVTSESHRRVVGYFHKAETDVATLDELVAYTMERGGAYSTERGGATKPDDGDRVAIDLHHSVLPKLDDAGLLDYDARTNTVRYHGHPVLDEGGLVLAFGGDCA